MDLAGAGHGDGVAPARQRRIDAERTTVARRDDLAVGRHRQQHRIGEPQRMPVLDREDRGDIAPARTATPGGEAALGELGGRPQRHLAHLPRQTGSVIEQRRSALRLGGLQRLQQVELARHLVERPVAVDWETGSGQSSHIVPPLF